jgi:transposase
MTPRENELLQTVAELRRENAFLRQKIDLLVKQVFGSSSEQLDRHQLELLMQLPESAMVRASVTAPEKERSRKSTVAVRKERLPENLPVVEEVIDPEPVKAQPEQWRCIGQEISEQLDYEPGRFFKRRVVRRKYVHKTNPDCAPLIAALPERLLDRSLPAPGLLAHLVVGKYCDHLPLYRQEQIYRQRHGVHLPRQSLTRWVELASQWLKPIYEQIRTGVMGGGYVQVDETPIEYLSPGHGRTKQGYLWTCSVLEATCFTVGKPAGPPYAWTTSSRLTSPAPFSATVTPPIVLLPTVRTVRLNWPVAGRMCEGSFLKPKNNRRVRPAGSCAKSNTSTGWKPGCGNPALAGAVPNCAPPFAPTKADPSSSGLNAPWSGSSAAAGIYRRACWAWRLIMPWASGKLSSSF